MLDFFRDLFSTDGFMPRWQCGEWSAGHGWLHIISDLLVFGAYAAIPLGLWYFIAIKKHQVPFSLLFWLFGAFIMSCGLTHLVDSTLFWNPWYRLSGLMKLITAVVSWTTVVAMIRVLPRALALPGLEDLNKQLRVEVEQRRQAESEREKLLALEREARNEAEHANRMKEEFVATLSHELRTPLNAILGYVTIMLEDGAGNEELVKRLQVIERNTLAQKRLIEDLLDINRIITGNMRLDVQSVDLGAVVEGVLDALRPQAMTKGVRIGKVAEGSAVIVRGDPTRLQQIVSNLVNNAVKFTPSGGSVDVALESVNSHAQITVTDTGIGMEADHLPVIFERFRQVETSSTRRYSGLGLGLAISKTLVEMHGGRIEADSPGLGKGATFRITLPLPTSQVTEHAMEERLNPHALAPSAGTPVLPRLDGLRLLVVDDDMDSRELLKQFLGKSGAMVQSADCAEAALAIMRSEPVDVLISDIGMPQKSGLQLIGELRSDEHSPNHDIPAVALTAFAATEDRKRALLAGFDTFLCKPVDFGEVVVVVSRMARRKR